MTTPEPLLPAPCPHCGNARAEKWHLICDPCWSEVPESLRNELLAAHKEGVGDPRHWKACQDVLRFLEEARGLKSMEMMTPIKGLVHVCTVRSDDGWEAMCCLWDGERWLFWEDAFDPPEWSPVTDINCVVEAWDLPTMPGSPVYRNRATPPQISEETVQAAVKAMCRVDGTPLTPAIEQYFSKMARAALVAARGKQ